MTVCIAALSTEGIVCVADKGLTYSDYTHWDADWQKILNLNGQAVAMFSSSGEAHVTRLMRCIWEIKDFKCHRYELIQSIEASFQKAYEDMQTAKVLTPLGLSREAWRNAMAGPTINELLKKTQARMRRFRLGCDVLICGYDIAGDPYILYAESPGVVTDYTNVGCHAIGVGAEQAAGQLLFSDRKKTSGAARALYECYDAKAHAEMTITIGKTWDGCFVDDGGPHVASEKAKSLVKMIWAKANRSPFDVGPDEADSEGDLNDWRERLDNEVKECLQIPPHKHVAVR